MRGEGRAALFSQSSFVVGCQDLIGDSLVASSLVPLALSCSLSLNHCTRTQLLHTPGDTQHPASPASTHTHSSVSLSLSPIATPLYLARPAMPPAPSHASQALASTTNTLATHSADPSLESVAAQAVAPSHQPVAADQALLTPSLEAILAAFNKDGNGDGELLKLIVQAKAKEDEVRSHRLALLLLGMRQENPADPRLVSLLLWVIATSAWPHWTSCGRSKSASRRRTPSSTSTNSKPKSWRSNRLRRSRARRRTRRSLPRRQTTTPVPH